VGLLRNDLRLAVRRLRRQPALSAVIVLTLALGLGANTAVFALVDALLLRSLPVERPEELYRLGDTNNCCVNGGLQGRFSLYSTLLFEHLRANVPQIADLAGFQANTMPLGVRRAGTAVPEAASGQFVTGNYFRTLGVTPAAGRLLQPDDDRPGAPPVVVLSYRTWQRFGLDPSLVGASVIVNRQPMTVVGVTAPAFFGDTFRPDPAGIWIPLAQEPVMNGENALRDRGGQHWLYAIGRLRDASEAPAASAAATLALQQWFSTQPFLDDDDRRELPRQQIVVTPAGGGVPFMQAQYDTSLSIIFAAASVLLLVACANLANLLLARADRGQAAIRTALGASSLRLVRQSITEGILLALLGGVGGVIVAALGTRALLLLAFPQALYVPVATTPSWTTLLFAGALATTAGVLFSAVPAWSMSRAAPRDVLAGSGRTGEARAFVPRRSLVITQVALSLAVIASAGLLARSLANLERQPLGFEAGNRLVMRIEPPLATGTPEQLALAYEQLRDRLRQVPGVRNASYALISPMDGNNWSGAMSISGQPANAEPAEVSWNRVGPDYFSTVGTQVMRGRALDQRDRPGAPRVAVINEAFAARYFPASDPIGQTVGLGGSDHAGDFQIVGVVDDLTYRQPRQPVAPMVTFPAFQAPDYEDPTTRTFVARSMLLRLVLVHVEPSAGPGLADRLRAAVAELAPDVTVMRVVPLPDQVSVQFRTERLMARLTAIFGLLALALAALGLYSVTTYTVAQRTREIGVRMALGARRGQLLRAVARGAVLETLVGVVLGVGLALAAGRVIRAQLYGLEWSDPRVLALAVGTLVVTAALAAAIPTLRATAIDPARALRAE
jgi:predicted permease